jgi:hypothetical protein
MLENMDPRFPIGPFVTPATTSEEERAQWIEEIAQVPAGLRAAVDGLTDAQLDTPYREGGWTVRQVVHHLPDSHMHAWVRMKAALTEDRPPVRAYDEVAYAKLADYRLAPVEVSLTLFEALHARWLTLLRSLTEDDFARVYLHSSDGPVRLDQQIALYSWHGRHHVAHITELRKRMGW